RVRQAAEPNEQIKKLAETVVEDEADPTERIRKIARKLHDSFKFLNSPKTFRSLECRPAGEVLEANYGNPLESAALCAALLRALDFDVSVEVSVVALAWEGKVPTNSAFDGVVVVANLPDGPVHVHPQHGVFRNPGSLGKHWLLSLNESGTLRSTYVHARGEKEPSRINITGKVTIDSEGNAAGDLHIRLTGAFYDPAQLETADQQKKLVGNMLGRVLDGFEVSKHSIAMLSDEVLRATVTVASKDTLKSYGKGHLLTLGSGPALLNEFPLPLKRSYRKTAVHLPGQARESVALTIELPEEWSAMIAPTALAPVTGSWGTVSQQVETDGGEVRFRRTVEITADTIPPDDFAALREAINHLRTTGSLHLVCGKSVPQP
ncbi:MAG: DUF3858 domain-containing protein, partial [Phycisphaerae bacterium]|nr:DUF3858 domain-containing protein [Phycisphaerae bacterium]